MSHNGTVGLTPANPLPQQIENTITQFLYRKKHETFSACQSHGLLMPLWMWVHTTATSSNLVSDRNVDRCARKVISLLKWLQRNGTDMRRVAVVDTQLPPETLQRIDAEIRTNSSVAIRQHLSEDVSSANNSIISGKALYSSVEDVSLLRLMDIPFALKQGAPASTPASTDAPLSSPTATLRLSMNGKPVLTQYSIVIVVQSLIPTVSDMKILSQSANLETCLAINIKAANDAVIFVNDACWISPHITQHWKAWGTLVSKLREEQVVHHNVAVTRQLSTPTDPYFGLISTLLPTCCGAHTNECCVLGNVGNIDLVSPCTMRCLKPYHCRTPQHVCCGTCHPSHDHHSCPYPCTKVLPCGHECKMQCGERCDCCHEVFQVLPCGHEVEVAIDKVTGDAVVEVVRHYFKGVCADKEVPCAISVRTRCAHCLQLFSAPCHLLTAQGHTLTHRTASCPDCLNELRKIRQQTTTELIQIAQQERKAKALKIQKELHERREGQSIGRLPDGAEVLITDITKLRDPVEAEMELPANLTFVDVDDDSETARLRGAWGLVELQAFVLNTDEDRYEPWTLVRLSTGKHVIVSDGGLRLLRADSSAISATRETVLMLTGTSQSEVAQGGDGTTAPPDAEETDAARRVRKILKDLKSPQGHHQPATHNLMHLIRTYRLREAPSSFDSAELSPEEDFGEIPAGEDPSTSTDATKTLCDEGEAQSAPMEQIPTYGTDVDEVSNVVVAPCGPDPQGRPEYLEVEVALYDRVLEERLEEQRFRQREEKEEEESELKKRRMEVRTPLSDARRLFKLSVQVKDLLPLTLRHDVLVLETAAQITRREDVDVLKAALRAEFSVEEWNSLDIDRCLRTYYDIAKDDTFTFVKVLNPPLMNRLDETARCDFASMGPICLLEGKNADESAPAQQSGMRYPALSTRKRKYVLVPYKFVENDELAANIKLMTAERLCEMERLSVERFDQWVDLRRCENDAKWFHERKEGRRDPVKPSLDTLYHKPKALPTREDAEILSHRVEKLPLVRTLTLENKKKEIDAERRHKRVAGNDGNSIGTPSKFDQDLNAALCADYTHLKSHVNMMLEREMRMALRRK